jgi:hypothetical protein
MNENDDETSVEAEWDAEIDARVKEIEAAGWSFSPLMKSLSVLARSLLFVVTRSSHLAKCMLNKNALHSSERGIMVCYTPAIA